MLPLGALRAVAERIQGMRQVLPLWPAYRHLLLLVHSGALLLRSVKGAFG